MKDWSFAEHGTLICGWCDYYSFVCTLCKKYNLWLETRGIIACAGYRKHHTYKSIQSEPKQSPIDAPKRV